MKSRTTQSRAPARLRGLTGGPALEHPSGGSRYQSDPTVRRRIGVTGASGYSDDIDDIDDIDDGPDQPSATGTGPLLPVHGHRAA